jgi:RNA polymerase sigma-70 factor (ECF subfamily)
MSVRRLQRGARAEEGSRGFGSAGELSPAAATHSGVEERELVLAAKRGDVLALSRLMDSLAPWIARICGAIALEHAEDAAQEALLQVFRDLRTLREPAALRGWARRIALREAVRHAQRARAERARAAVPDEELSAARGAPSLAPDVRAVLAQLAPEQRAILVLRDLEGLSEQEAAAQLGLARGTVKSRLFRAREAFARRWRGETERGEEP